MTWQASAHACCTHGAADQLSEIPLFLWCAALGSTDYTHFCQAGKNINKFMAALGASSFYPMAEADDAMGCVWAVGF